MKTFSMVLAVVVMAFLGVKACFLEDYFPLCPSIDTVFASGYSEANFDLVVKGMTREEVVNLLGRPFTIQKYSDRKIRYDFSHDGACAWLGCDFAWLGRSVFFEDGVVVGIEKEVFFD